MSHVFCKRGYFLVSLFCFESALIKSSWYELSEILFGRALFFLKVASFKLILLNSRVSAALVRHFIKLDYNLKLGMGTRQPEQDIVVK